MSAAIDYSTARAVNSALGTSLMTPIQSLINAVNSAVAAENWYAALGLSLALPDICGWIDEPDKSSKARYVEWFNRNLLKKYTVKIGAELKPHVFLTGEDCYALRCSFLHHGIGDIQQQKARKALTEFKFHFPSAGAHLHCNKIGTVLQLQVDIFCHDIANAVGNWYAGLMYNPTYSQRIWDVLSIHPTTAGFRA